MELAVDAGELHAELEMLRARLAQAEQDRDAWRTEAGAQADRRGEPAPSSWPPLAAEVSTPQAMQLPAHGRAHIAPPPFRVALARD